jgi:hypothetical protein
MRISLIVTVAAAALGLAGCNKSEPAATDGASSTPAPAAETAAPAAAAAPTVDGPAAGKWKITMTTMGQTMPATETCYATQTSFADAQRMQQQAGVTCAEQSYNREGDAVIGHSVCSSDIAGKTTKITTYTRITGDFKTKYTMDITRMMDPAPAPGKTEQKITMTAERLGDC